MKLYQAEIRFIRGSLGLLIMGVVAFATASPASAKTATIDDYVYLQFTAEKIRDNRPLMNTDVDERKTADISRTKYYGKLELYFVPGDLLAPAFVRSRFNMRREDHSFSDFDTGFREAEVMSSRESQRIIDLAHAGFLPSGKSIGILTLPLPVDSIVFGAGDAPAFDPAFKVESNVGTALPTRGMLIDFILPLQSFVNPAQSFTAELRTQNLDIVLSQKSKSTLVRNILYGSGSTSKIEATERQTLERLLSLSSCKGSLGGGSTSSNPRSN